MKFLEILKYNSALFFTGLFLVFISSVAAGNLLLNAGISTFVISGCIWLAGSSAGLFAARGYEGKAEFVPDYFIVILPVTAFLVVFTALIDYELAGLYAFIWGFSVGVCFGLLIRCNPSPRSTGFPVFALGAFGGGMLSIPVLSGEWHLCDTFAILATLIALTPTVLFSSKLKSRKSVAILALVGFVVCGVSIHGAREVKKIEAYSREASLILTKSPTKEKHDLVGITPFLPPLLQTDYAHLRILFSGPEESDLPVQLSQLPFVSDVVKAGSTKIHHYYKPFSWHSGLRKNLTAAVSAELGNSNFNVVMIFADKPLSPEDNRFYTMEFYDIVSRFMMSGGIAISNVNDYKQAAVVRKTMLEVFDYAEVFPGRTDDEILVAGSNTPITIDYNEIDRRAFVRLEHFGFCRGMLLLFLPPVDSYDARTRVAEMSRQYDVNTDLNPFFLNYKIAQLLSFTEHYWFPAILLIYLATRFLLSRKIERRVSFSSFENGIFCGGFVLVATFTLQAIEGRIFLYTGWLGAIFTLGAACGYGLKLHAAPGRTLLMIFSALLPATLLLYTNMLYQEYYLLIVSIYMLSAGFAGGLAANMFATALPEHTYRDYLNWMILGMTFGAGLCWLFLASPHMGLVACVALLAAVRLPLIFRPLK